MFRIHIGLPDLHEKVLRNSLGFTEGLSSAPYLVGEEDYLLNLAPFVNTRDKERAQSSGLRTAALGFIDSLRQHPSVVVTNSRLLGTMQDALSPRSPFPLSAGRIARLSKLLLDHNFEFHLLIARPIDYFFSGRKTLPMNQLKAVLDAQLTWSSFVQQLRNATLGRPIYVWDFEMPDIMAPAFRARVLGPGFEDPIDAGMEQATTNPPELYEVEFPDYPKDTILTSICALDDEYDADLDALERMSGVTLVRSTATAWS
jgi:hypothetical protein